MTTTDRPAPAPAPAPAPPQESQPGPSPAESVLHAAAKLPELTARLLAGSGRAAADTLRHPERLLPLVQRLPQVVPLLRHAVTPLLTGQVDDWAAEYAYTTGVQAFVYGFPYIYNAQLRHEWVTNPRDPERVPYAPVGEFWHARQLLDASYRDGGCPNNDTLYSLAWIDLSDGPVVLSHPDMGDRYFTFALVSFTSDNFAYVGQRSTGSGRGDFAIRGPGPQGPIPAGVRTTRHSPTPWALVLGRTLVAGEADLPAAHALQDQYRLTPLSRWGKQAATDEQERRDVYTPATGGPLAPWKTLNAMLAENPPPAHHAVVLEQFARLGIGPGLDVEAQPDSVQQGLARAAVVGQALLRRQFLSGDWATVVNGWRYPPPQEGRFGDDFLQRAADQSLAGIAANDPAEAVYLVTFDDADGAPLAPGTRYELRFAADELPPVEAFWSLTAYTSDMNLIANPADRYSVGDRTPGLRRDPDGGLTLHLQPGSPGENREPNWLPTSPDQPWFAILRLYRPHREVIRAEWRCPGIRPVP